MRAYYTVFFFLLPAFLYLNGCSRKERDSAKQEYAQGTFGYDVEFLSKHQEAIVLSKGEARLAVCPAYQGRVMTSSSSGEKGLSYGWINYELVKSGEILEHINPVGGEDRFWLGPEGGQFSVFFERGDEFVFDYWQTPPALDSEPFQLVARSKNSLKFKRDFQLTNYSGNTFAVNVQREISLVGMDELREYIDLSEGLETVAYKSANTLTNSGQTSWTRETGALSIWILGMFIPSDETTIIVPYQEGSEAELGPVVNDAYFGKVPSDRLRIQDGVIFFRGDGRFRSKIGLNPKRAKSFLGSYDGINHVLTLVFYTKPKGAKAYVNSMWELQEKPFDGDAINSYNDGPVNGNTMGPFYELETSSPAAFLAPKESSTHTHITIHIRGSEEQLDPLVMQLFGVDLSTVETIFQ